MHNYKHAILSMARLNRNAARLMHKYDAHASTDVTGFGLLGHATNLAESQKQNVKFVIHSLPVIAKIPEIARALGNAKFLQGTAPETSGTSVTISYFNFRKYSYVIVYYYELIIIPGGLLICLPKENAENFCKELEKIDGWPSFVIGDVVEGDRTAVILENPTVIETSIDS